MPQERTAAEIHGRDFPTGAVVLDEGEVALAALGAGGPSGEMALLEGEPRSAAAVVARPALLPEIHEAAFSDLGDLRKLVELQRRFEPEERPRSTP
jgi:CRP-like cAMP-binding protein